MQSDIKDFGEKLMLPDTWQSRALGLLRDGRDVVLHAPTGAGKTYVFELLMESSWRGRAVYTVPTRALANDKFREWRARGWEVGLVTGDVRHKPDVPRDCGDSGDTASLHASRRRPRPVRGG